MTSAVDEMAVKIYKERLYPWEFNRKGNIYPTKWEDTGKLPIWNLFKRLAFLGVSEQLFRRESSSSFTSAYSMLFVRCQSIEFTPAFHELMEFPGRSIRVEVEPMFIGKTSWMYETKIFDQITKKELANRRIQTVNIDEKTRRPKPLPDWAVERFAHLTSQPRPQAVQPFDQSDTKPAFVYTVTVAPSDVDYNLHTNQSQYARYCFDCATAGAKRGAYSIISGDLLDYEVRSVDLLYQKESVEGDVLHVESWEDIQEPDTIKFQVKRGDDNILQCKIRFCIPAIPDLEKAKL